jgi:hypothetical protein
MIPRARSARVGSRAGAPLARCVVALALAGCAGAREGAAIRQAPAAPIVNVAATELAAAARPVAPVASDVPSAASPPTWSALYAAYFAVGGESGCGRAGRCHATEMGDAASAYAWLSQRGYIAGTQSALASRSNSCLRWFGGNMPPGGASNPQAAEAVIAWVAAGARDD